MINIIRFTVCLVIILLVSSCKRKTDPILDISAWPVIRAWDQDHLYRIALPLGGIGTGTLLLRGNGELCNREITDKSPNAADTIADLMNAPFFSIYTCIPGNDPETKALIGPHYEWGSENVDRRSSTLSGITGFEKATFEAAYPFGQVHLSDSKMPVDVTLKAFNPLTPCQSILSGIPIAVLQYEVKNKTDKEIIVSICGIMRNLERIYDRNCNKNQKFEDLPVGDISNRNVYRKTDYLKGIFMNSSIVDKNDPAWGNMALTTSGEDSVTFRTAGQGDDWNNSMTDIWDDFSMDGDLTDHESSKGDHPVASLAIKHIIDPGKSRSFKFYLTWYFPNKMDPQGKETISNYYTSNYFDSWEVAYNTVPYLKSLEKQTILFINTLKNSNLPPEVVEAALFNLSTLRSPAVFRDVDGRMSVWEGSTSDAGNCSEWCKKSWDYEQAIPYLFGDLSKSMREVEFENVIDSTTGLTGYMAEPFLKNASTTRNEMIAGQMKSIMKFYRDWQLSGDSALIVKYWPKIKSTLASCWLSGGWDHDKDGVMKELQYSTMSVDDYRPNPQMELLYLGALRASEVMAAWIKDTTFAKTTHTLFVKGSEWTDKYLFNGEYFEQNIKIKDDILSMGCQIDQLAGQYLSHICGLGYLVSRDHVAKTLLSIRKYNYVEKVNDHFNNFKSNTIRKESGLLMVSWPKGKQPIQPQYCLENITGLEYLAAAGMLFEGMNNDGEKTIKDIRNRFDGAKRNPFNESDCVYRSATAMSSWASILALTEFQYSAVKKRMQIKSKNGSYFWSTGYAWGKCEVAGKGKTKDVKIYVFDGKIELKEFNLRNFGTRIFGEKRPLIIKSGEFNGFSIIQGL